MKRIIASLLAGLCLLALVGCSAGSKADSAAPKDYSQIIHDARTDEDNEYDMIFTKVRTANSLPSMATAPSMRPTS